MTNAENLKRLRLAAVAKGLCYMCRCRPTREGVRNCDHCIRKGNEYTAKTRAKRDRQHRCTECGRERPRGRKRCLPCHERTMAAQRARREQRKRDGLCTRCDLTAETGKTMCGPCLLEHTDRVHDVMYRRHAEGKCAAPGCSGKLTSKGATTWWCPKHAGQQRERVRRYQEKRRAA